MADTISINLKKSGLKITSVRRNILEILENSKKPLSARELLLKINANKTTIYREIETLLNFGYLNEVNFGDRSKRYELSSLGHHHHLVCLKCKNIADIKLKESLKGQEQFISKYANFKVLRHNLEFFGLCANCV